MEEPLQRCLTAALKIWRAGQDPWFSPNTFTNIKLFKVMSEEWTKHGNDSWRAGLRGNVQGTRHSPSTLPTMVLGQDFRIVIRPPPLSRGYSVSTTWGRNYYAI